MEMDNLHLKVPSPFKHQIEILCAQRRLSQQQFVIDCILVAEPQLKDSLEVVSDEKKS